MVPSDLTNLTFPYQQIRTNGITKLLCIIHSLFIHFAPLSKIFGNVLHVQTMLYPVKSNFEVAANGSL